MSPAEAPSGPSVFEWNAAAARLHERILEAAEHHASAQAGTGSAALLPVIDLHAPVRPIASAHLVGPGPDLFAADGRPVCHGCDRAELTPTRDALYPCRTTRVLGENLLDIADLHAEFQSLAAGGLLPSGGPQRPTHRRRNGRSAHANSGFGTGSGAAGATT